MFGNNNEKDKNKKREELIQLLKEYNAQLLSMEINYKVFGNIIVEIEFKGEKHTFVTDRGEINHNNVMICNSSYHIAGKSDTFPKLLEVIKKELF